MERGFLKSLDPASFGFDCEGKEQLCNLVNDSYQVSTHVLFKWPKSLSLLLCSSKARGRISFSFQLTQNGSGHLNPLVLLSITEQVKITSVSSDLLCKSLKETLCCFCCVYFFFNTHFQKRKMQNNDLNISTSLILNQASPMISFLN